MASKQALAALLIAILPQLESLAVFHVGELSPPTESGVVTPSAEVRIFDFSLVEQ